MEPAPQRAREEEPGAELGQGLRGQRVFRRSLPLRELRN